jgi:hypothetical protein
LTRSITKFLFHFVYFLLHELYFLLVLSPFYILLIFGLLELPLVFWTKLCDTRMLILQINFWFYRLLKLHSLSRKFKFFLCTFFVKHLSLANYFFSFFLKTLHLLFHCCNTCLFKQWNLTGQLLILCFHTHHSWSIPFQLPLHFLMRLKYLLSFDFINIIEIFVLLLEQFFEIHCLFVQSTVLF